MATDPDASSRIHCDAARSRNGTTKNQRLRPRYPGVAGETGRPSDFETEVLELLCEVNGRRIAGTSACKLGIRANVYAAAQEGAGRDDHGASGESPTLERLDA